MADDAHGPDLSIVFHAARLPMAQVAGEVRSALQQRFDVQCVSMDSRREPGGGDRITVGYRLTPLAVAQQTREKKIKRIDAHCELLDRLKVPNGCKAISIALHEHWSVGHRIRFGEPANPATVKRWRTDRHKDRLETLPPPGRAPRRLTDADRILRGLRRHHAVRTTGSGGSMHDGYRRALADIDVVNSGAHPVHRRPATALRAFSYATFRRDCLGIKSGQSRRRQR